MNNPDYSSIESLKALNFEGPDISLDISLFEYGCIWKKEGNDYRFIYKSAPNKYSWANFRQNVDLKKEFSWMDADDWKSFFSYMDLGSEEEQKDFFNNREFIPLAIYYLSGYYGVENVFGSDYSGGFEVSGDEDN